MSKNRLIPKLQMRTSSSNTQRMVLVVTQEFSNYTEIGDPVSQAKIFQDQGADELIFVCIEEIPNAVQKTSEVVFNVSKEIFMPICVGGGVKTMEDFRLLLSNGADKIAINSVALQVPNLISEFSQKFGAQCVVVSIDYKQNAAGEWRVFSEGGKSETAWHPLDWALKAEEMGAGELLICSISNDGQKAGMELEVSKHIANAVKIPVIISGGCGEAAHFVDGFKLADADAVAAGSFFAHRDQNFMQTRAQIKNGGVNIRSKK